MKKILFILFSTILLASCSDDKNTNLSNDEIIGAWDILSSTHNGESKYFQGGNVIFKFNSDKTYTIEAFDTKNSGTYNIENNIVEGINSKGTKERFEFNYSHSIYVNISYTSDQNGGYEFSAVKSKK